MSWSNPISRTGMSIYTFVALSIPNKMSRIFFLNYLADLPFMIFHVTIFSLGNWKVCTFAHVNYIQFIVKGFCFQHWIDVNYIFLLFVHYAHYTLMVKCIYMHINKGSFSMKPLNNFSYSIHSKDWSLKERIQILARILGHWFKWNWFSNGFEKKLPLMPCNLKNMNVLHSS